MAHPATWLWLTKSSTIARGSTLTVVLMLLALSSVVFPMLVHGLRLSERSAPPTLTTASHRWDFGTVEQGQILETHFVVRNAAARRLVLNEEPSGCGCTSSRESTLVIPPRSTRRIEAHLETTNICGPIAVDITYSTNDPRHPTLRYTLIANVVAAQVSRTPEDL